MSKKPTYEELEKRIQELELSEIKLKKAEKGDLGNEYKYQTLISNIPGMVYRGNPDWSTTIISNCEIVCGYSIEEFNTKKINWMDLIHPDDKKRVIDEYGLMIEKKKSIAQEYRIVTKDGRISWLSDHKTIVLGDEESVGSVDCVVLDITERKQAEEALRKSEQLLSTHLLNTPVGAISLDLNFKIIEWNPAAETIFGYTKEEAMGKHVTELILPEDMKEFVEDIFQDMLSEKGGSAHSINENITKDGRRITCDWYNTVLKDADGMDIGMASLVNDITKRKQAEKQLLETNQQLEEATAQAEMANIAKSEFLATMSHELRTPLNAIIGFSEILENKTFGELNQRQERYVNNVLTSGKHLLGLINDILDLSKVEAGKMELELSSVNIKNMLETSLIMIWEKAMKHDIKLDLQVAQELSGLYIQADERKLKQIMFNLLSNAVKFTKTGGSVNIRAWIDDCQCVHIRVVDSGIGIDPSDQERIFGKFEQIDSSYARNQEGTGLGLSLTKELVALHKGRIWVESEGYSKGCTFTFTIPFEIQEEKPNVVEMEALSAGGKKATVLVVEDDSNNKRNENGKQISMKKILIIDDEPQIRSMLKKMLEREGFDIIVASDGNEGMKLFKKNPVDLVITDIIMPEKEGIEIILALRQGYPNVPIFAMSGGGIKPPDGYLKMAKLSGAQATFEKPFKKEELLNAVKKALEFK